jgi:predicted nucleic acid-binding protein
VIDSSITLAWSFIDEQTDATRAILDRVVDNGAIVPSLWRYEVVNSLQMAVKRQRIDLGYRDRVIANLRALDIRIDGESDDQTWAATVRLANNYGLTVYDAAYVELAQRRSFPLASLDAAMLRAASALGIEVLP